MKNEKTKYKYFAENLRKLRKCRGLTQIELASALETTNKTLSTLESGASEPRKTTVEKVSEYFDVDAYDLCYCYADIRDNEIYWLPESDNAINVDSNPDASRLLSMWMELSDDEKQLVLQMAEKLWRAKH